MLHNGDIRNTSIDTVVYAQQLEANRATPCAYKGRADLNVHIPKWTYPLVTAGDYVRLQNWQARCLAQGLRTIDIVDVGSGNSQRV
jgi:L-ascorbate metabolism protein UlaG (beta-lactamase superfamily)